MLKFYRMEDSIALGLINLYKFHLFAFFCIFSLCVRPAPLLFSSDREKLPFMFEIKSLVGCAYESATFYFDSAVQLKLEPRARLGVMS